MLKLIESSRPRVHWRDSSHFVIDFPDLPRKGAVTADGQDYSYDSLLSVSEGIAASLLDGSTDLGEERVAFLIPASFEYVAVQWGIWRAGGIAVPG